MKKISIKKLLALATATVTILASQIPAFAVDNPPTAPGNLTYSDVGAGQVTLHWDPSTDDNGVWCYGVFNGQTLIDSRTIAQDDTTTWVVKGLYPLSTYTLTVKAYDTASQVSGPSNGVTFTTLADTVAPTAPTGLGLSGRSGLDITLQWFRSTDNVAVNRYRVYWEKDGVRIPTTQDIFTVDNYKSLTLEAGHTYKFYVNAIDGSNNESGASNAYTVSTL